MSTVRSRLGRAAFRLLGDVLEAMEWIARLPARVGAAAGRRARRSHLGTSHDRSRVAIRVQRVAELSAARRLAIRLWLHRAHGWREPWASFDWYVTAEAAGRRVGVACVVKREGQVGGAPARLCLLGGVYTVPELRGHGIGSAVVGRATRLMAEDVGCQCQYGVLICRDALVPFYERLGWRRVPNEMAFERFGEPGVIQGSIMVRELTGRRLPPGTIDVRGLPA